MRGNTYHLSNRSPQCRMTTSNRHMTSQLSSMQGEGDANKTDPKTLLVSSDTSALRSENT